MEYILQRDGKAPIIFKGEVLSESVGDRSLRYCHDLRIYQTPSGKMILEIIYSTTHSTRNKKGHPPRFYAFVCKSLDDVMLGLAGHRDEIPDILVGPSVASPGGVQRREELLRRLLAEYDTQISQLLDKLDFAEQVD